MEVKSIKPDYYRQPCSSTAIHAVEVLTGCTTETWDECFDLIKETEADYFTGAAIKYLWRCQKKGYYCDDLIKARTHLQEASIGYSLVEEWTKTIDLINELLVMHDAAKDGEG